MIIFLISITKDEHKHILIGIYERYYKDMLLAAYAIVRDMSLAEDIVQESFERIIKKIHIVEKISCNGLRKYTVLIVRSVAINMIKKEDRFKLLPLKM